MTFRHRSDPARDKAWRAWIDENRSALERIGLPLAIYQDADHWQDFLENGHLHYHDDGPPFDVLEDCGPGQQEQLWAFLEKHYAASPPNLLQWMRVRLQKE